MKKAVLFLCLLFCLAFLTIIIWPTKTLDFGDIPVLSDAALDDLADQRTAMANDILSFPFTASGETLPTDRDMRTWYTPALTDDIALELPHPWRVARTKASSNPTDGDSCRILIYNDARFVEYTLIETGLPVISIALQRFDLDAKYIQTQRTPATARILSANTDGTLTWSTNRVEIKTRGMSSQSYPKKSYTLFFRSGTDGNALHAPLGLPADSKFALNAMYEDDSKIRDALAYRLAAMICPDNALQFTYTELLIDNRYFGLYGMHQIITEHALQTEADETVYKINSGSREQPADCYADALPNYEIAVGSQFNSAPLEEFFQQLIPPIREFPSCFDRENFVNYTVLAEVCTNMDTSLKNYVIRYDPLMHQYRLIPWDMDQTFGLAWDPLSPLYIGLNDSLVRYRYTEPNFDQYHLEPIDLLYDACPDFADAVAERYRELRQTVFTDEALLSHANALYDQLTACGARQRDAERWPNSVIGEDNSFIQEFIPARMAFLDQEFDFDA